MIRRKLVPSLLFLYLGLATPLRPGCPTMQPKEGPTHRDDSLQLNTLKELQSTLSKIYPLAIPLNVAESNSKLNPRFCWKFFRPDPAVVTKLSRATASYKANIRWMLVAGVSGQTCFALQVPDDMNSRESAQPVSDARSLPGPVVSDVPEFCRHIEAVLDLTDIESKSFDYDFRVAPPLTEIVDFWDLGTHVIWIVPAPTEFAKMQQIESSHAKRLQFSLTLDEWLALYSDVFDWKSTNYEGRPNPSKTDLFPILSRLSATESETLDPAEVRIFRGECIRAYERAHNLQTFQALNKLVIASNWALELDRGLYFRGP